MRPESAANRLCIRDGPLSFDLIIPISSIVINNILLSSIILIIIIRIFRKKGLKNLAKPPCSFLGLFQFLWDLGPNPACHLIGSYALSNLIHWG